jgi:alpha-tubulin suppressor-like RCC1 family protein
MATGYYHSCARLTNGQAECSGRNDNGQLGTGDTDTHTNAFPVRNSLDTGNLTGITQLAAGENHTCALLTNQEVRCWGRNNDGQLGDGTANERHLPVPVKSPTGAGRLTGVAQISAGLNQTCAVLTNGQARCWGNNDDAQLGDGTEDTDRRRPVAVRAVAGAGALTGVTQIELGQEFTCARLTNGQARCWGHNDEGELGDGTTTHRRRPTVVRTVAGPGALSGVRRVSAGGSHACATLTNGQARCWGYNSDGVIGDGTTSERHRPTVVRTVAGPGALVGVANVDAGYYHSCAQLTNGQARCWGDNFYDQVGNGVESGPDRHRPTPVRNPADSGNLVGVRQLQSSDYHTCVTLTNAQGRCWGYDEFGALGRGSQDQSPLPVIFHT